MKKPKERIESGVDKAIKALKRLEYTILNTDYSLSKKQQDAINDKLISTVADIITAAQKPKTHIFSLKD